MCDRMLSGEYFTTTAITNTGARSSSSMVVMNILRQYLCL